MFVVIFPILFGFAIAFTNYNLYHTPPAKLVDWVGLKTLLIFSPSPSGAPLSGCAAVDRGVDAAGDHPAVYGGRTAGDSGQPKDLRFKPLIRTIFILPWAVPGFVTILVFAGMFNDSFGVINNAILSFLASVRRHGSPIRSGLKRR